MQDCTFFSCIYLDCIHKHVYGKRTASKQDQINLQDFHFLVTTEAVATCTRHHITHRTSADAAMFSKWKKQRPRRVGNAHLGSTNPVHQQEKQCSTITLVFPQTSQTNQASRQAPANHHCNHIKNSIYLSIIRKSQFQSQKCEFGSIATGIHKLYKSIIVWNMNWLIFTADR